MTREDYINNIFSTYDLVSVLSEKNDCRVLRLRHKTLGKDLVLRCYSETVAAYEALVCVKSENLPLVYDCTTLDDGQVVLTDLNVSRQVKNVCRDTVIMGTVGYASPEQLGISQSDARTDIYAVGVLLNVMLTGKHPSESIAKGKAGRIVRKCTSISPDDRYKSAESLFNVL